MTVHTLRRHLLTLPAALLLPALAAPVQAQADKTLKLLVGFPPGTGPDVVARLLGQRLGEVLKQALVVDNRAGAGGQIAAQAVAKSPPDGGTVLLGEVGSISIAPHIFSKLPYDPARELTPVCEVVRSDFVLVVPATSAARTVADFVQAAKARKDKTYLATFGAGTPGHFGANLLGEHAGFAVEPVHYRSTGDAITAILAGDVAGAFVSTALALAQVKGGKMRALATTAPARSPLLPDVPTFAEAGQPRLDFAAWFALLAPAGTPPAQLDTLQRATANALQHPETRSKLQEAGFTVVGGSRADAARLLDSEARRWAAVVKAVGFKAD